VTLSVERGRNILISTICGQAVVGISVLHSSIACRQVSETFTCTLPLVLVVEFLRIHLSGESHRAHIPSDFELPIHDFHAHQNPSHHGQWGYHPSFTFVPKRTKAHAEIHKAANWYISFCADGESFRIHNADAYRKQKLTRNSRRNNKKP
jgi:hypothetical protein